MKQHQQDGVIRNVGVPHLLIEDVSDVRQIKSRLAAEIVKNMEREDLTAREAHARTGIAAADFSRIRNADLNRFTVDRLINIVNRLGARVEVKVIKIKASNRSQQDAAA